MAQPRKRAPKPAPADPPKPETGTWRHASGASVSVRMVPSGNVSLWLRVTSQKTDLPVYLPMPIRLIQEVAGGGSLVRGAHGDESTTKESPLEILAMLDGVPLKGASEWRLAG